MFVHLNNAMRKTVLPFVDICGFSAQRLHQAGLFHLMLEEIHQHNDRAAKHHADQQGNGHIDDAQVDQVHHVCIGIHAGNTFTHGVDAEGEG